uniref:Arginine vasotocin receptor (Fragments) n=1 Tax=Gallus gallus TaxID=9031 RepID=Q9PSR8_CHICK
IPSTILITCQVKICKIIKRNIYTCISKAMIKTVKMTIVTVVVY